MTRKNNYFVIAIILLIILLGNLTLIRTQKDISNIENRTLKKFEHFTIKTYLDGPILFC